MNNKEKLQALANEFAATMKHAQEVYDAYMEVAIEQAIVEAFNEMSDSQKAILLLGMFTSCPAPQSHPLDGLNADMNEHTAEVEAMLRSVDRSRQQEESDEQKELAGIIRFLKTLQQE